MHKIYETKGSFDLEYLIPKIICSSLISMILNTILQFLALSNESIIEFKKKKSKDDIDKRQKDLMNKLKIKFILFFILGYCRVITTGYQLINGD